LEDVVDEKSFYISLTVVVRWVSCSFFCSYYCDLWSLIFSYLDVGLERAYGSLTFLDVRRFVVEESNGPHEEVLALWCWVTSCDVVVVCCG
jgi:hypothetical protein